MRRDGADDIGGAKLPALERARAPRAARRDAARCQQPGRQRGLHLEILDVEHQPRAPRSALPGWRSATARSRSRSPGWGSGGARREPPGSASRARSSHGGSDGCGPRTINRDASGGRIGLLLDPLQDESGMILDRRHSAITTSDLSGWRVMREHQLPQRIAIATLIPNRWAACRHYSPRSKQQRHGPADHAIKLDPFTPASFANTICELENPCRANPDDSARLKTALAVTAR